MASPPIGVGVDPPPPGAGIVRSADVSGSTWMIFVSGRAKRSRWFCPQIGQKSKPASTCEPQRAHFSPPRLLGLLRPKR